MNVLVLTKNLDTYYFGEGLMKHGYSPIVCTDFESVVDFGRTEDIAILLCDFRIFGLESRNPYESLKSKLGDIPFVFYNDPFPGFDGDEYLRQWRGTLLEYSGGLDEPVEEFLEHLSRAVLSGCPAGHADFESKVEPDPLLKMKSILDIPNSKWRLMELLYEKRGERVSVEYLSRRMWDRFDSKSVANLYAYVSFLRGEISKHKQLGMTIKKSGDGGYVFDLDEKALENF